MNKLNILICGLGSIGKRHARLIHERFGYNVFALRTGKGQEVNDIGIPEFYSWHDIDKMTFNAAFITNPTDIHLQYAVECAKRGMHLFIEKPLSNSLEGISTLAELVKDKKLTVYTAYCLRFHPVIKRLKELVEKQKILHVRCDASSYLPDWRPAQDIKRSYSSFRNKGGGAVLELSHEFDYLKYLFGGIVKMVGSCGRISRVTHDAEDYADAIIEFSSGTRAVLLLNIMSRYNSRKIVLDTESGYIFADILNGQLMIKTDSTETNESFNINRDDYLSEQLDYFFKKLGEHDVMNNLEESQVLLEQILGFRDKNFI